MADFFLSVGFAAEYPVGVFLTIVLLCGNEVSVLTRQTDVLIQLEGEAVFSLFIGSPLNALVLRKIIVIGTLEAFECGLGEVRVLIITDAVGNLVDLHTLTFRVLGNVLGEVLVYTLGAFEDSNLEVDGVEREAV